jgi:hypothetical protein
MEPPYSLKILRVGTIAVGFGFGINTSGPNNPDRFCNVIGSKTAGENNGCPNKFDDAAADRPVVGHAERADLAIRFSVAVQQQKNDQTIVAACDLDALLAHHRHASHDEHARQLFFERRNVGRGEKFGGSTEVDDRRVEFACPAPISVMLEVKNSAENFDPA